MICDMMKEKKNDIPKDTVLANKKNSGQKQGTDKKIDVINPPDLAGGKNIGGTFRMKVQKLPAQNPGFGMTLLTTKQVSDYIGIALCNIRSLGIPRIHLSAKRYVYDLADVDRWLQSRKSDDAPTEAES